MEEVVSSSKLHKEVFLGRISSSHSALSLPNLRISPLGVVPKKAQSEFCLIHHLFYPHSNSVNDAIDPPIYSIKHGPFDTAVDMVRTLCPVALLDKCDITSAFRLFPVYPDDFNFGVSPSKGHINLMRLCQWVAPYHA